VAVIYDSLFDVTTVVLTSQVAALSSCVEHSLYRHKPITTIVYINLSFALQFAAYTYIRIYVYISNYHADGIRVSIAFIRSVILSARYKTKTADTKIAKLGTEIVHHAMPRPPMNIRSKGQRQCHITRSKSAKSRDKTAVRRRLAPT